MKRIYKNWPMHNLIGHPLMQIFEWLGMPEIATRVHDETLPANTTSRRRGLLLLRRKKTMKLKSWSLWDIISNRAVILKKMVGLVSFGKL